jgi:hypothetical protein
MHFKAKLATAVLAVASVLGGLSLAAAPALAAVATPVVTSVTPDVGVPGPFATLVGSFDPADTTANTSVYFGSVLAAVPALVTTSEIIVAIPPGHGLVAVRVLDPAAVYSAVTGSTRFLYTVGTGTAQNVFSHLFLRPSGTGNGSAVVQGASHGWTLEGNGEIRDTTTGKCLDARGFGTRDGTTLQLWTCSGNSNQHWKIKLHSVPTGTAEIIGQQSHKCVDDRGYSTVAGGIQQLWTCNQTDNQRFLVI